MACLKRFGKLCKVSLCVKNLINFSFYLSFKKEGCTILLGQNL